MADWHFVSLGVKEIDMDVFDVWASGDYHWDSSIEVDNIDQLWQAFVDDCKAGDPDYKSGDPTVIFGDDAHVVTKSEFADAVLRAVVRKIYDK
jgi:hypothetical protein